MRENIQHIKGDLTVPMVVVGNKVDLQQQRSTSRQRAVDFVAGMPYFEMSAKWSINVDEVLIDLCRQMIPRSCQGGRAVLAVDGQSSESGNEQAYEEQRRQGRWRIRRLVPWLGP